MLIVTPLIKAYQVSFTPPSDIDLQGFVIHASTTSGFTPSDANLVSKGPDTKVTIPAADNTYYIRVAAFDSFEDPNAIQYSSLNYSVEKSVVVSSAGDLLTTLEGQITESQLASDLRATLDTSTGTIVTSASAAQTAAANAAQSAINAATSASTASGKASDAAASATAASSSAGDAYTYYTAASTSANDAASSATAAGTHASDAAGSASSASTYATNASNAASAAATSSTTAGTYASDASGYAATAQSAASTATSAAGTYSAQYTLKVDANGHVAGIGLFSDSTLGSQVQILADQFSITDGTTNTVPFIMSGGVCYIKKAMIQTADVDTLQIKGQAVTIPVSAFTSGSQLVASTGSTVQTITITTDGSPVLVTGSVQASIVGGGIGYVVQVSVNRDGNSIGVWYGQLASSLAYIPLACSISDTPPAGTHTYVLSVSYTCGGTVNISNSSLTAICVKR